MKEEEANHALHGYLKNLLVTVPKLPLVAVVLVSLVLAYLVPWMTGTIVWGLVLGSFSIIAIPFAIGGSGSGGEGKKHNAQQPTHGSTVQPTTSLHEAPTQTQFDLSDSCLAIVRTWVASEQAYMDTIAGVIPSFIRELPAPSSSSAADQDQAAPNKRPVEKPDFVDVLVDEEEDLAEREYLDEAKLVVRDLAQAVDTLLKPVHKQWLQVLNQALETRKSTVPLGSLIQDNALQLTKAYEGYWKDYANLKKKYTTALFSNMSFRTMVSQMDAKVNHRVPFSIVIAEPVKRLQLYTQWFTEIREHIPRNNYLELDEALRTIRNALSGNQELLEQIETQDRLADLKQKLALENLDIDTFESSPSQEDDIPRLPKIVCEGLLHRVHQKGDTVHDTISGPFACYLLSNVFIVVDQRSPTSTQPTPQQQPSLELPNKKIFNLNNLFLEKTPPVMNNLSNAFALKTMADKKIVFRANSTDDYTRWVTAFEQVFDSRKPTVTTQILTEEPRAKEDNPQTYYQEKLEDLYKNPDAWRVFELPESPANIEYMEDGKTIRYATMDKLIQKLTSPKDIDYQNQLLFTFMLTYRNFTTPEKLLQKLRDRFNTPPSSKNLSKEEFATFKKNFLLPVRLRICQVLQHWIEKHSYDFRSSSDQGENSKFSEAMSNVIEHISLSGFMKNAVDTLRLLLAKHVRRRDTFSQQKLVYLQKQIVNLSSRTQSIYKHLNSLPTPVIPRTLQSIITTKRKRSILSTSKEEQAKAYNLPIEDWSSVEIARQLTLIEFSLYENIRPKECLNQAWNKAHRAEKAPNINSLIERTNLVVNWVGQQIVKHEKLKERAHSLKKFIKVARECKKLNNFNSCFEIVGGLSSIAVHRLKKTWEQLPQSFIDEFKVLQEFCHQQKNYRNIRNALKSTLPPCMPYLGIYLTDLTFIEDGNQNFIDEIKINFFKLSKLAVVIQDIQRFQKTPYTFVEVPELANKMKNMNVITEDRLTELSFKLEPKQAVF